VGLVKQNYLPRIFLILTFVSASTTLIIATWTRTNIADLRSLTTFYNEQEIVTISSSDRRTEFDAQNLCKSLDSPRNVLRIAIRGYIEVNDDDVMILALTDQENGLRIIMNEARQPIVYFESPLTNSNAKGYELAPPLHEFISVGADKNDPNIDVTISLFFVSLPSDNLTIQTEVSDPFRYSRLENIVTFIDRSIFCSGSGVFGIDNVKNSLTVKFSSAQVGTANLDVNRNLRAHGLVSMMMIGTLLFFGKWLESRPRTKTC
jgi:hypothetical protein